MSDLMFNEVPLEGKKFYRFGDWKEYAIHDEQNIKGFFGSYKWLSNFYDCEVWYEGHKYPNSECAYQAAKLYPSERLSLTCCSAYESKKIWKKYKKLDKTSEDWDKRKYDVMSTILFDKFYRNKELRQALIETGDKYLEETLHWHDNFWGNCICEKCKNNYIFQNNLGKILMKIRKFW